MITKHDLDLALPDTADTLKTFSALSGLPVDNLVEPSLVWLAEATENDRFTKNPEWKTEPWRHHDLYPVTWRGLDYKRHGNHLTAEGWPADVRSWFCLIESGMRWHIGAETASLCLVRSVIIFARLVAWRRIKLPRPEQELFILNGNVVVEAQKQ